MEKITLYINGEERQVEIGPMDTLLHVIREVLGLTGTKEGCGEGDSPPRCRSSWKTPRS